MKMEKDEETFNAEKSEFPQSVDFPSDPSAPTDPTTVNNERKVTKESKGCDNESKSKSTKQAVWVNLEDNLHGVLATCDRGKEAKCTKDLIDLFNEFVEEYDLKFGVSEPLAEGKSDMPIETALQNELQALRQHTARRFYKVECKCNNMVFIRFVDEDIDPVHFVHELFENVLKTKKACTRFVNKLIPIQNTTRADIGQLLNIAKPLIEKHFHYPNCPSYKFMVEYRHRYNNTMNKTEAQRSLVRLVGFHHKVDLQNPDKIIVVEVFPKACGVSIVDGADWVRFKQFNLRTVSESFYTSSTAHTASTADRNQTTQPTDDSEKPSHSEEGKQKDPKSKESNSRKAKNAQNDDDSFANDPEADAILAAMSDRELAQKTVEFMDRVLNLEFEDPTPEQQLEENNTDKQHSCAHQDICPICDEVKIL